MELDLHSLFGLHVHSCSHWLRPRNPHPHPPHLGSCTSSVADPVCAFLTPDQGWVKSQDPDPGFGAGMNNPDHIS
jgi:hypothetical protein